MKSRFLLLTSRVWGRNAFARARAGCGNALAGARASDGLRLRRRRGYSLTEVVVASALMVMILTAVTAILSMAGTMQQVVTLQTDADQGAVKAMNRMILEVREAK